MITVLNKPEEFPVQKTPLRVPARTCACGHVTTVIEPGAKWSFYPPCDGLYYNCVCGSTHVLPMNEALAVMAAKAQLKEAA